MIVLLVLRIKRWIRFCILHVAYAWNNFLRKNEKIFWLVRIPHVAPWSWTCDLCYDMGWERVSRDSNNRSKYKIGNYVSSWLQATNGCIPTLTGFPTAICSLSGDDSDSMSTDRYCWDTNGNVAKHPWWSICDDWWLVGKHLRCDEVEGTFSLIVTGHRWKEHQTESTV